MAGVGTYSQISLGTCQVVSGASRSSLDAFYASYLNK